MVTYEKCIWSRSYLNVVYSISLPMHHQKKKEDNFVKKYTAKIKKETQLALNGQCRVWTGCSTKGRGECLFGKACVKFLHGDRYKWQGFHVHCLDSIQVAR